MTVNNDKYLFCNALPWRRESFDAEARTPEKDFVRHFIGHRQQQGLPYDWKGYCKALVEPYNTLKNAFSRRGFTFLEECTAGTLKERMERPQYEVIIFFSHCINNGSPQEAVEFADGMVPSETIVAMMPESIVRVYDFSVCRPGWLAGRANILRPKNIFGTSENYIPLSVWLVIYFETFRNMVLKDLDYVHAFDRTILDIDAEQKKANPI